MGFKNLSNQVTYTDNGGSFDNQLADTVEVENSLTTLANTALASVTAANTAKEAAEAAKTAAETAETNAETAETNAETAETNAETAETNAAASATASANSATAGANSATAAATSETNSASSANTATTKANTATTQATNSANSATAAATSETNAASSATAAQTAQTNAETAETNAETAETNAETAETNAAASAVTAATQATNSSNSATASATSATAAQTAQTAAETAETNAETAETNAETAETNAAASASTASTQAGTATTKASEAATSATNAANSATNAANSATGASNSQIAAASSAASAAAIFDQFDDTYLGTKSSAPTVDNDGNALATGALFYNSSTQGMFIWTGSEWVAASAAGGASLNNFSYTATAGQTTFSGSDENSNTMSYTVDNIIVTLNGVVLEGGGTDYTATNGSSIVLTTGAVVSDEVNIVAFKTFTTADMVSASNGGAYQGNVDFAAGIDVTGNITVTGTVDGRDLAADGTKLDAIEANANVTDTANVTAAGALMDSEVTNLAQVKAFDSSDYATAAQGTLATNALPRAGGTMTGDVLYNDSVKAKFGAGSDLQIYHDGNNSIINEQGDGDLLIYANNLSLLSSNNSEYFLQAATNGAVSIRYDNSIKLATTSTGIDVTGTVTSDGLTVNPTSSVEISGAVSGGYMLKLDNTHASSGNGLRIETPSTASNEYSLVVKSNNGSNNNLVVSNNGDISFYEDTGTTAKFFWDASAESLGIGTSSPSSPITVSRSVYGGYDAILLENTNSNAGVINSTAIKLNAGSGGTAKIVMQNASASNQDSSELSFFTGDGGTSSEAMRIDASGNVGIGTSSPAFPLDVSTNSSTTNDAVVVARISANTTGTAANNFGAALNFSAEDASGSLRDLATINSIYTNATNRSSALTFKTRENLGALTERMRIDSSGNVGIGTSSPSFALDLQNNAGTNATWGRDIANLVDGETNDTGLRIASSVGTDGLTNLIAATNSSASQFGFMTFNGSAWGERMRIDSSGNVGILNSVASTITTANSRNGLVVGSGSGNNGVTIYSGNTSNSSIMFADATSGSGTYIGQINYDHNADAMLFSTTAAERMRIDSSGRVGIGTTSPLSLLDVTLEATGQRRFLVNYDDSAITIKGSNASSNPESLRAVASTFKVNTGTSGSGTERMRIDSSGRVTTPYQPLCAFKATVSTNSDQRYGVSNTILNQGSHLDTGSNSGRFTCPVAGNYKCTFVGYTNYTSGYGYIHLRKNGTSQGHPTHWNHAGNAAHTTVGNSFIVNCAAGNYLEFWLLNGNARVQDANITFELIG